MESAFVTARVNASKKARVDKLLISKALNPSQLIQRLYGYIDATGRIPKELLTDVDEAKAEARQKAVRRFNENKLPEPITDEDVTAILAHARGERFA